MNKISYRIINKKICFYIYTFSGFYKRIYLNFKRTVFSWVKRVRPPGYLDLQRSRSYVEKCPTIHRVRLKVFVWITYRCCWIDPYRISGREVDRIRFCFFNQKQISVTGLPQESNADIITDPGAFFEKERLFIFGNIDYFG